MKHFRPAAWLTVLALVAGVMAPARAAEPEGRKVRVVINGWENNLTPFSITFASQPNTVDLLNLVYDTLFWSQAKADPEPWLAEQADPSHDRKSWTVTLRSGVTWHDGRPFSAQDVAFTFEYFKRHADQSGRFGHHVADLPTFDRAQVLDENRVRLFFEEPVPSFEILPGGDLPMLPKHIWQRIDRPLEATSDKPVGTGPFKMAEMVPRERYRLQPNPQYFKGEPLVDELELSIAGDPNVAFNDLVAGKIDLVSRTVPPIFVDQLSANSDLKVVKGTRMESIQLNFNALKDPLSDPKLRKAISLSIDNRVLVKTVLGGRGLPGVDSFVHPASSWAMPDAGHEFDVGKANQLLDSAGYSRKDSDGVRRGPGGKRLEFAALFSTLEPQSLQTLRLISQMTTAIGVRMDPEPATPARLRTVRRAPPGTSPAYDAYISSLETHTHADPDGLLFLFHSPGKGIGAQITGYSNPAFDAVVDEAATTVVLNQRKRKLHEAQTIFAGEVPALALMYPDGVYSFRPAAYEGWVPDPGHGILTKRSFLEDYAGTQAGRDEAGGPLPPAWLFLAGVASLVLAGTGLVLLRRRRPRVRQGPDLVDPEVELLGDPVPEPFIQPSPEFPLEREPDRQEEPAAVSSPAEAGRSGHKQAGGALWEREPALGRSGGELREPIRASAESDLVPKAPPPPKWPPIPAPLHSEPAQADPAPAPHWEFPLEGSRVDPNKERPPPPPSWPPATSSHPGQGEGPSSSAGPPPAATPSRPQPPPLTFTVPSRFGHQAPSPPGSPPAGLERPRGPDEQAGNSGDYPLPDETEHSGRPDEQAGNSGDYPLPDETEHSGRPDEPSPPGAAEATGPLRAETPATSPENRREPDKQGEGNEPDA